MIRILVGAMFNEHGGFWPSPLPMIPNVLLSNSSFGADAYEEVFQSCLSPFYYTDGLSLIFGIPLIFREGFANFGMKSSGNIL